MGMHLGMFGISFVSSPCKVISKKHVQQDRKNVLLTELRVPVLNSKTGNTFPKPVHAGFLKKNGVPFGVPTTRIMVFWLYIGAPIFVENYQILPGSCMGLK